MMITQRSRGLVNLHVAITTLVATQLFLAMALAGQSGWLGVVTLGPELPLLPYAACVVFGMLVSARHLNALATRFHRLMWVDAAQLSTRQVFYVALFLFTLVFATKDRAISRVFVALFLAVLWAIELFVNQGLPRFLSRLLFQRQHKAPTLFIGNASQLGRLSEWLATKEVLGIQPVGFITGDGVAHEGDSRYPFLGTLPNLKAVIENKLVAQVIVLEMPRGAGEGRFIIDVCQDSGCRLMIYSNLGDQLKHPLVPVIEEGHAFFSLQDEPLEDPLNRLLKRAFDIALALPVVLVILPVLWVWVWLMQRVQAPGPVMFVQERAGQNGHRFRLYKFRSMYAAANDPEQERQQARRGDQRVYPFGLFIRRTSIDEFPQFLNVLLGHMSIVGPRPHMPAHDAEFSRFYRGYRTRHFAKPGITGLAQTRGYRGEITEPVLLQKRVLNDLYYISHWSIWLDLQITVKTAWQVLFPHKAAY